MEDKGELFIVNYFNKQISDIRSLLDEIPGVYKVRDIHQLRVRIKRLKAVFRLLEFIHPVEFKAKDHYRLFKPVFNSAGLIRESQINLGLLEKFKGTEKLYKSYSKYINKLRPGWDTNLDKLIESFNYSRIDEIVQHVNDLFSRNTYLELIGLSTDFIYSELDRIKVLLDESEKHEYIHEVRIILKNIKPTLGLIWPLDESTFEKSHYNSLTKTETLIGNWHDRLILSEALSLFYKARGKKNEKLHDEYEAFQNKINKTNKAALDNISRSLADTLRSFH